jgi:transposase
MNIPNLPERDKLFYGLDLSKSYTQAAVLDEQGEELANFRFRTTRENLLELAGQLRASDTLTLEVSCPANASVGLFRDNSKAEIVLSNPLVTALISRAAVKTDKEDARKLADLTRTNYIPKVWFPDGDTLKLRHMVSDRESLVRVRTQLKNRVHSVLERNLVRYEFSDLFGVEGSAWLGQLLDSKELDEYESDRIRFNLSEVERYDALISETDALIAAFLRSRAAMSRQLDILLTVPGISLASGAVFLAAAGDITRFGSARQFACYLGLTQRLGQTGKTLRMGRISKCGNAYARFMMIESAEALRKAHTPFKRLYERIKSRKNHNVAVVAVARKLAELVWTLLVRDEEFIYAPPRLTDEKRALVNKLARKTTGLRIGRKRHSQALYGTRLRGREIKQEIHRRATDRAMEIYDLMMLGASLEKASQEGFDPKRPRHTDWQRVLDSVAEGYAAQLPG